MTPMRSWPAREHLLLMSYIVWLYLQQCSLNISATMCLLLQWIAVIIIINIKDWTL